MSALYNFKRPRNMVLYIRTAPNERSVMSAELQEEILRQFCERDQIPVCCVIRHECSEEKTIPFLEQLIERLPPEADSMIAIRCTRYSSNIYELSRICFFYSYYGIVIYSMEFATKLWENLSVLNNPYDPGLHEGHSIPLPPVKNRLRCR